VSTREDLEAALRARPDDATLAVYADYLQAQGDPRGELIALDLTPPAMSTNGLEVRRGQLLEKWLGDDIDLQFDRDQQLWYAGDLSSTYATFNCGFISLVLADLDDVVTKLLGTSAGTHLREVSMSGSKELLRPVVDALASRSRPWLQRLAIHRPPIDSSPLLSEARCAALAQATPSLELLELSGERLMGSFTHPSLRTLAVLGSEAIDLVEGPSVPSLHTLDYAFAIDRQTPRGLVHPSRFPALRRLDFSREEPGALYLFDILGTIEVAPQITHLVVPAIRTNDDHALVQAAIDRMPLLREVEVARAYTSHSPLLELRHAWARIKLPTPFPWPPRETLLYVRLRVDGFMLDLSDLVSALEEHIFDLSADDHAIWVRFWAMFEEEFVEHAFNAADLVRALAPLADSDLAALRAHLQARIAQRPQGYLTSIRFAH
jgi:uncharacterized protein (TIGR02996 family)